MKKLTRSTEFYARTLFSVSLLEARRYSKKLNAHPKILAVIGVRDSLGYALTSSDPKLMGGEMYCTVACSRSTKTLARSVEFAAHAADSGG
ncbi:hypothetical protein GZ78_13855 [Endozoicomonas numazuensis]|uniref:Uncharacterized protein n=1 Tax=Endozoicomonas numazuensis TaxID=1137799 RepID=A0A081NJC4_9GAMM|nr:hypothetical protein GZ78_13855 [Endozoicomonas numazuensis]